MPPPDEAAADSYLGNGYFPSWCATSCTASSCGPRGDPRYAYGETILTVWPPPANFAGLNAVTRVLHCDDDGDGRADRTVTVPMPIFHASGCSRTWATATGCCPSGPSAATPRRVRVARRAGRRSGSCSSPTTRRTRSRGRRPTFDVTLDLDGLGRGGPGAGAGIPVRSGAQLPLPPGPGAAGRPGSRGGRADAARLAELTRALEGNDPAAQREALKSLRELDPATRQAALATVLRLAGQAKDPGVREAAAGRARKAPRARGLPSRRGRADPGIDRVSPDRHDLAPPGGPTAACESRPAWRPTAATSWSLTPTAQ